MEQLSDEWKRPYFTTGGESAFVFYVVFGVDASEGLRLSRKRHHITGIPEGLEVITYDKDQHADYIEGFYNDSLRKGLASHSNLLLEGVTSAKTCTVVKGSIEDSASLEYLKNTIGIIQALCEQNAVAVLDLLTLSWYSGDEWATEFFEPQLPQIPKQVTILYSRESSGFWYHTRGMRKFGRPDISVVNVDESSRELAIDLVNRFIQLYALGGEAEDGREITIEGFPSGLTTALKGDYENLDFNNYYIEIEWKGF